MAEHAHSTPLIPEQRQQKLLDLVRREGVVSTRELTAYLGVSHMTVRRDIAALEADGQVESVQGGVRAAGVVSQAPPTERTRREVLEQPRKSAIAERAAALVTDGMVIFLDAGTTCQAVVPHVTDRRNLTIVTNDFYVVSSLFGHPQIEVIHTGGLVDAESGSSTGVLAAAALRSINIDLQLMSTASWSVSRGVTARSTDQVELKRAVMAASVTSALLADSTKYGTVSRFHVVDLERLDLVISDDELPRETGHRIEELGVELVTASMRGSASQASE